MLFTIVVPNMGFFDSEELEKFLKIDKHWCYGRGQRNVQGGHGNVISDPSPIMSQSFKPREYS